MLTDEERLAVEKEVTDCECPESASVEALQALQRYRGWISDEAIGDLAPLVGMSPDELDGVATFYSFVFRRPVGRHVIFLCDSLSCLATGYEEARALFADARQRGCPTPVGSPAWVELLGSGGGEDLDEALP